jgi:hypothetical protein
MNENMQKTYIYIINLEFDKANELLRAEQKDNPTNRIIILQENYIDFLTIIIGEDESFFTAAKDKKSDRINSLKAGDESSPYYLYAQAEIHLQWAFARLKFEEYLTASYEIQKAYSLLEENQENFPDFKLNKKGLGLLHTLVGAIPNQYQWALSLAGMEGGVASGLAELKSLLQDEQMELYRNEIVFLTTFLQLNMTNDEVAYKQLLAEIGDSYSDSYLLNFAAARLTHALGENDLTLNILENRPPAQGKFPFYYLDYLQGMSLLYKLDFEKSKQYFNRFLNNFKGNNYIKSAYHKLALMAFLEGATEKRLNYFEKVKSEGSAVIDEDKMVLKDAKKQHTTHYGLLSTRLLYDGGYYQAALKELQSVKGLKEYSGFSDEYWYRLARIQSKLDYDTNEIIAYYQEAFEFGKASSNYFAPMSALQIAFIYEKKKEYANAKIYFEKCLSLSNFDYERGIHQKAKSGLSRISD